MKNKILLLMLLVTLPINVLAASGSINASSSSSKVNINTTVTVTVKVSSSDNLGSWQYGLSYDKSKLSLVSGDTNIVGYGDGSYKIKSYTYKFKTIATGTASISIDNAKIVDWETENAISTSSSGVTLTIKEPVAVNYSSDNNLKSLTVDGFDISPEFNKSTLEYSVTVLGTTTSIKINATANDSKAKISGTGEHEVVEGNNSFSIVVTAENGTSKTYTLNVVVPEKDPIKAKFNNEEYSVLRKLPEDKIPLNFHNSTITINNEEVACVQNETLNLTLIYLRDKNNKEGFYIYNEANQFVIPYNEITNNDVNIFIQDAPKDLDGMIKTTIKINELEVKAYQIQEKSKDYIIYGKDTSTGKSNFYVYDKNTQTISLFNEDDINYLRNSNSIYKMITYILGILIALLLIIIILINSTKKKLTIMVKKLEQERYDIEESKKKGRKNSEKN